VFREAANYAQSEICPAGRRSQRPYQGPGGDRRGDNAPRNGAGRNGAPEERAGAVAPNGAGDLAPERRTAHAAPKRRGGRQEAPRA